MGGVTIKQAKNHVGRSPKYLKIVILLDMFLWCHSYDILGAGMLWKPKEARILTNFIDQPMNSGKHSRTKNVLTRCFTKNFHEF
jgi:hypothetical protein